ncbi:pca operon transcription factor PcaQ [Actibacterium sp. D379-3]
MDPRIRLRHIRCFLETARIGSLGAAAEALHISQPAASKTLRELEELLGAALFDRVGRRLVLNPAGRIFQHHAGAALVELNRAQDLVRKSAVRKSRVSVGVLPSVGTDLFPRTALRFRDTNPDCILRVSTGPNWMLLSQLRDGGLDMVVGRMAQPDTMAGLSFRQLYTEQVALITRPDHPLTGQPFSAEALSRFPLMLPPKGALISPVVRAFLMTVGLQHSEPAFENVSLAFGRKVVQMSDVVWFISRGVVRDEIASGALSQIALNSDILAGPIGVSVRENAVMSAEQRCLTDLLIDQAGALSVGDSR